MAVYTNIGIYDCLTLDSNRLKVAKFQVVKKIAPS